MRSFLPFLVVSLLSFSIPHIEAASSGQLSYCSLDPLTRKYGKIATADAPNRVVAVMNWVREQAKQQHIHTHTWI